MNLAHPAGAELSLSVEDGDDASDHLEDLHGRDGHGDELGGPDFDGLKSVVGVHERVDGEIHEHEQSTKGCSLGTGIPGEHEDSYVMVPVEENDRSLSENEENRVTQFGDLGEAKCKSPECSNGVGRVVTGYFVHASFSVQIQKLLTHSNGAHDGEDSKSSVPYEERSCESERFAI